MIERTANGTARAGGAAPAAPAGGARRKRWGRGCGPVAALLLAATAAWGQDPEIRVPSGLSVQLIEVLTDENPGEMWLRFRFLAPDLSRGSDSTGLEAAADDMDWLCRNLVLPYLEKYRLRPVRVVLSISDRPVPFGETNPEATQIFETYRVSGGECVWEAF